MGKFIILTFFTIGSTLSYFTYEGKGQEKIETVKKEASVRSNSYRTGGGFYGGSSYNSGGYSYGK
jgi:uncharacterized membrane protein YgcG